MLTKEQINTFLEHCQKQGWIDADEFNEMRDTLYRIHNEGRLDILNFEAIIDMDYAICESSYIWKVINMEECEWK